MNQAFLFSEKIKKPAASYSRTGESRTTLGDGALDFRVRNGNGYDNSSMATGKGLSRVGPRPACPRKYLPDYGLCYTTSVALATVRRALRQRNQIAAFKAVEIVH